MNSRSCAMRECVKEHTASILNANHKATAKHVSEAKRSGRGWT